MLGRLFPLLLVVANELIELAGPACPDWSKPTMPRVGKELGIRSRLDLPTSAIDGAMRDAGPVCARSGICASAI
jgi:hypothetical protein